MGISAFFKSLIGKRDIIAEASKLIDGKVDAKNLASIYATYLFTSKLSSTYSDAKTQAASFAQQVDSVVSLNQCSDMKGILSKLKENNESSELYNQLKKAVNLIKSMA